MKNCLRRVTLCCVLLCLTVVLHAQNSSTGDIRGTVTDPAGAVVPGALVTVTNIDTGVTKTFTTNNNGIFMNPPTTTAPIKG